MEEKLKAIEEKLDKMEKSLSEKLDMIHSFLVAVESGEIKLK